MLEAIKQAAREAGKIMLDSHLTEGQIEEKEGHANFVTAYDVAVQKFLAGRLPEILPEAGFLGEEGDGSQKVGEGYTFIVDPIDGTTNFIVGYQMSAVSIGLAKDGEAVLGVVYNPFREEMYWAEKGKGAFLNGRPLKIRDGGLKDGVVCFGTAPYNPEYWDRTFKAMREVCPGPSTSGGRGARRWTSAMWRPGGTSSSSSASSARGTTPPPSASSRRRAASSARWRGRRPTLTV